MAEKFTIRKAIVGDANQIAGLLKELGYPNTPLPMEMWNPSERRGLWQ